MESLIETIRNELARCLEKAYPKISVRGATAILNLSNDKVLAQYAKTVSIVFGTPDSMVGNNLTVVKSYVRSDTGPIRMDITCLVEETTSTRCASTKKCRTLT